MKIFAFSDVHGNGRYIQNIINNAHYVDILIGAGDLTNLNQDLNYILSRLNSIGKPIILVPGNMEYLDPYKIAVKNYSNIYFLHGETINIKGLKIAGFGGGTISPFDTPLEYREEEIKEFLENLDVDEETILVTHVPPLNTILGETKSKNVGSLNLRLFIEKTQPKLHVCGHIHESAGRVCIIGKTPCINVGPNGFLIEIF